MASKKNTDCVYFLASPFTCKKGMQCEFRHSDVARLNPRDCWYWLSGNCLNPDCAFRHPPLESEEEQRSPSPEPSTTTTSKGRVPCYFYSQGYCAKGDKCSFMHGYPRAYNSVNNGLHAPKPAPAVETKMVVESETGLRKPAAETTPYPVPEEEKRIEGPVECCSPVDFQGQAEEPVQKLEIECSPEQELYCDNETYESEEEEEEGEENGEEVYEDDDEELVYDDDEDTVLNPAGSILQQQQQPAGQGVHEFGGWTVPNGGREPYSSCKLYDPPYQPSVPYDCMITSRMEEHRLEPGIEALLVARDLGMNHRRRLEDRLVFPRNNSIANRLKYFNTSSGNNNSSSREVLFSHGFRPRLENLRRVSNAGVLSRLGSSRPSIKSRLRFTNHRQQQQQQQQQQQLYQFHDHHQNHRHLKAARYLGIVQQQNHRRRVSKRPNKQNRSSNSNTVSGNDNLVNNNSSNSSLKACQFASQFDGPKSLAELKAAKLV